MTQLPLDPTGYSVNTATGTVHTRYATHAGSFYRTRTAKGVETLLDGRKPKFCEVCYGKTPRYTAAPPAPPKDQKRRVKAA